MWIYHEIHEYEYACLTGLSAMPGGGFDGTERAGTRSDGRKQGRNSADGCGEDRAFVCTLRAITCEAAALEAAEPYNCVTVRLRDCDTVGP